MVPGAGPLESSATPSASRSRRSVLRVVVLAGLLVLVVSSATAWAIGRAEADLRDANIERFAGRAEVTASMVAAYLDGVRGQVAAAASLAELDREVAAVGLDGLVVRDASGALLTEWPSGQGERAQIASDGRWHASTDGAGGHELGVGLPHADGGTVQGWMRVEDSRLAHFLAAAPPAEGTFRQLVDARGSTLIAQGRIFREVGTPQATTELARPESVDIDGQRWLRFAEPVSGSELTFVLAIPEAELLAGTLGWVGNSAWVAWGLLSLVGVGGVLLVRHLAIGREQVMTLNEQLHARQRGLELSAAIVEITNGAQRLEEAVPHLRHALSTHLGTGTLTFEPGVRTEVAHASDAGGDGARDGEGQPDDEQQPTLHLPLTVAGSTWGTLTLCLPEHVEELESVGRVLVSSCTQLLERELIVEELRRSNQELEQFAFVASHDLQEPLRKISSYSQLVQRRYAGQLDAEADEFLEYAVDGARRMQGLIEALLRFSRAGRGELAYETVPLDALLDQVLDDLQLRIEDTAGSVERAGALPIVVGDPDALGQVLRNLIDNALRYAGAAPPHIVVSGHTNGRRARLVVADDGIGIPPQHAELVFGLFQRLDRGDDHPGTGLGLAICRRLVERGGGSIRIVPAEPPGTQVELELPLATEAIR